MADALTGVLLCFAADLPAQLVQAASTSHVGEGPDVAKLLRWWGWDQNPMLARVGRVLAALVIAAAGLLLVRRQRGRGSVVQ